MKFVKLIILLVTTMVVKTTVWAQSANDNCSSAVFMCADQSYSGNNFNATIQSAVEGDGDSSGTWGKCFSVSNTVWYKFTTNSNGGAATVSISNIMDASSAASSIQALLLSAPTPCALSALTSLDCKTASGTLTLSSSGLSPNTSYYVLLDGVGSGSSFTQCNFDISVSGPAVTVSINTSKTDATCNNNNGTITVTSVDGGSGSYTYSLSATGPFQAGSTFSNLAQGSYTVYVKDASGCIYESVPVTVGVLPKITNVNTLTTNADCNQANGSVSIDIVGGSGPFTVKIPDNSITTTTNPINIGSLVAGTYYLSVTDANGCDTVLIFYVSQNNGIEEANGISTESVCNGATGTIDIVGIVPASTVVNSYVFGANTYTTLPITGVPAGANDVVVVDENNCRYTLFGVWVNEGTKPNASFSTTNEICDKKNGTISVFNTNGGVSPYTYLISGGGTAQADSNFTGLTSGTYYVTIYDSYQCSYVLEIPVAETQGPTSSTTTKQDADCNANNGSVNITPIDGTPPYQYSLDNNSFQNSNTFIGLAPGSYMIFVKDNNGCIDTLAQPTIDEINKITNLYPQEIPVVCASSFGSILVSESNVEGGISPYTFSINGGAYSSGGVFTSLPIGTYSLSVKDVNGCEYSVSFPVTSSNSLSCTAGPEVSIIRGTSTTLSATTDAQSYNWTPSESLSSPSILNPVASPVITTLYTLSGTSVEGCTTSCTSNVIVIPFINPPTAFTPNGDGTNDVWEIEYLEFYPDCEVDVFNRWGQRVFHSKGYPDGEEWKGEYSGGKLPAATYYYVINLNTGVAENADNEIYKGAITLVR